MIHTGGKLPFILRGVAVSVCLDLDGSLAGHRTSRGRGYCPVG